MRRSLSYRFFLLLLNPLLLIVTGAAFSLGSDSHVPKNLTVASRLDFCNTKSVRCLGVKE